MTVEDGFNFFDGILHKSFITARTIMAREYIFHLQQTDFGGVLSETCL